MKQTAFSIVKFTGGKNEKIYVGNNTSDSYRLGV